MENRKRVLIVEDDRVVKDSLERLLQESDCETDSTLTAEEGLEKFRKRPYDFVFTDLRLPGMDGLEMISRMRRLDSDLPFIVLSAYGEVEDALRACKLGAVEFFQKPFDVQQVLSAAQNHLQRTALPAVAGGGHMETNAVSLESTMNTKTKSGESHLRKDQTKELIKLCKLLSPAISIGRLTSGITHNLNSPLTGLMGQLELMKIKNPELSGDLDTVMMLTKKIRDIILSLSTKYENETLREEQPQNINQILRFELGFLQADLFFKHHLDVALEFQEPLPNVFGNYLNFALAFEAVLVNAVDAQRHLKNGGIRVKTSTRDELVCVEVEDEGPGFTPEALEHAFEPLWPEVRFLEDESVRTGLGLYLSKLWLEEYGGRIEIGNQEQTGAWVRMTLPARRTPAKKP